MQQSFWSGASGLKTQQFGVDSWSNNIANINTVAYKTKRPHFSTMFASYMTGTTGPSSNVSSKGYGSTVSSNKVDFSIGTVRKTSNEYDLAIQGKGFFVLKNANQTSYTRDGSFHRDVNGYLVTSSGKFVQGVDLGKYKNGVFTDYNKNEKNLNTQNIQDLTPMQIPQYAEFRAEKTTDVKVSLDLNTSDRIAPVEDAYGYISKFYSSGKYSANTEDIGKFYDIKKGDIFSIKIGNATASFAYGTDFNTIDDLKQKIDSSNVGIRLNYANGLISLQNISNKEQKIDFSNSSTNIKEAFGLPSISIVNAQQSFSLYKIDTQNVLKLDFNALTGENGAVKISKGDRITAEIKGVKYDFFYGKANETIVQGQVKGEKDTFLTIGDFLRIYEEKTGIRATIKNSKIHFKNQNDPPVGMSSSNDRLLNTLGLPSGGQVVKSGIGILGSPLSTSTYSFSNTIYDKTGKKYYIKTRMVLQKKEDLDVGSKQTWHTSSFLLDSKGNTISAKSHNAFLVFEDTSKPPVLYDANSGKKIDNLEIDFLQNGPIKYKFDDFDNGLFTKTNYPGNTKVANVKADGNSSGVLNGTFIDDSGRVILNFSNNKQQTIGRIAMVDFINPQGLELKGNNEYMTIHSPYNSTKKASGNAIIAWDSFGTTASKIISNRLENSNVDLSDGLTALIALQRAFGANSKVITTSDEMEKEAINLKR